MPIKPIFKALREVKFSIRTAAIFHAILDSIVLFAILYLISFLTKIPLAYALIAIGIYLPFRCFTNLKKANLIAVEKKFPQLQEQLITVADNLNKENLITKVLNEDVLKKLGEITNAAFYAFGNIAFRLIMLIGICLLIVFLAANNVSLIDFNKISFEARKLILKPKIENQFINFILNQSEPALGNASIAKLGKEEIDLKITQIESEIDLNKVLPPEQKFFKKEQAVFSQAAPQSAFEETIPKDYLKIVKRYFSGIAKS